MIKFGSSGVGASFVTEVGGGTPDIPAWLKGKNLDCYEYSFGRGVRISGGKAELYGKYFAQSDIEISVHAPYYINFANDDGDKTDGSVEYVIQSLGALNRFGGTRCVVHPGAQMKLSRDKAMDNVMRSLDKLTERVYGETCGDKLICLETMGKCGQMGTTEEIIEMCKADKIYYPCIDFGHINARERGSLRGYDDYKKIIDRLIDTLGEKKTSAMHVHFSKIMYTDKGEVRHLTFADGEYGPPFESLIRVLSDYKLSPYVICESAGTQVEDALTMSEFYKSLQ